MPPGPGCIAMRICDYTIKSQMPRRPRGAPAAPRPAKGACWAPGPARLADHGAPAHVTYAKRRLRRAVRKVVVRCYSLYGRQRQRERRAGLRRHQVGDRLLIGLADAVRFPPRHVAEQLLAEDKLGQRIVHGPRERGDGDVPLRGDLRQLPGRMPPLYLRHAQTQCIRERLSLGSR